MSSKINAISTGVGGLATSADASGILEIQTNDTTAITVDGSQVVSFDNNFGTVAGLPSYQCRAWVNFNGTGTVAIRASGNVSSITDNGTGNYTINFTTAMPDVNYAAATQGNIANNATNWGYTGFERGVRSATGYVVQFALTSNYVTIDPEIATVAIFR